MGSQLETFGEVVNEVLNFGFNDGPQVNRGRIERWINEAQFQIAREVEASEFQSTEELTLKQGTHKYPLPSDFLRIQDIYYPELVARLKPLDLPQYDMTSPAKFEGPPENYTLYGNELWLFPTPNNSTDILEVRYIKNAPALKAEGDIPLLDKNYLHLLVDYAVTRAFEAEDDLEAAQAHKARFKEDLDGYATDKQWRTVDSPGRQLDRKRIWRACHLGPRSTVRELQPNIALTAATTSRAPSARGNARSTTSPWAGTNGVAPGSPQTLVKGQKRSGQHTESDWRSHRIRRLQSTGR